MVYCEQKKGQLNAIHGTLFTLMGVQRLSGRVLDSRLKGRGLEPHQRHCLVFLSKNINPSLVLVQPRKTRPSITERLLMGHKESNQTKFTLNQTTFLGSNYAFATFLLVSWVRCGT